MKRRAFLTGAATAGVAAAAASTLAKPAIAQGKRELKMVTTWPKNFPGLGTGAQRAADRITAATEGRITVKVYAAGELVPPFESFDAVSSGTADCMHAAAYYWQGKSKGFNFFTAVPMGLLQPEMDAWIQFGGGQELWDELGAKFNLKPLPCGNTGVQMGGWFRKEIKSVEDFKGLKFRMPGAGGEVLRKLGAAVVALPGGEIFPALQSGAIDATEWVGPWNDMAFGFYRVAKFYYWPGYHEPGSMLECTWNKGVWDSFSKADQGLITDCCLAENNAMMAEFNARNGDSLKQLIEQHGVQLREFSDEIYKAFAKASEEVLGEMATESDLVDRIYNSFLDARDKSMSWTRLANQGYANKREAAMS
ncbi:TRAP-type mannitol/chloroaromatic compound transport system, substrate-binding protein [Tistlia consotensis]|uniref:TRAP-type mannitol/chloroaromatic compound transport system, substrate-binding protein n=1 Tax=Tistlia consotensis USBA 355 TaxID=560819 RepID=A0A1Y6BLR4_9PROT|nr:TRAP transporter substrate-binding protein [Tistlia consotensis]SMF18118.1 TRAP-type mannitol/chloroaromatic compound transport system, substrate-binding protein [Tistlia consotensis USBA 355]SNR39917.1 TRAP-type mannitol/chloroaromatic compound transport system, substrate-binding protein [Tistlia consotensis]